MIYYIESTRHLLFHSRNGSRWLWCNRSEILTGINHISLDFHIIVSKSFLVGLWRFDASIFFISSKSSDFVVGTYERSAKCCFVIESKNLNSKFVEFFEIEKIVQLAKDDKWFDDICTNFNSWKQSSQFNAPQWSLPHVFFLSEMREQKTCSVKSFCVLQTKHSQFFHPFFYKREVVCPVKLGISVRHNCFWTSPRRRYQNIPNTMISFENHIFQI